MAKPLGSRSGGALSYTARIVIIYTVVSALWILSSDVVVEWLAGTSEVVTRFQTFKGLLFIAVTATLLHILIRRAEVVLRDKEDKLRRTLEQSFQLWSLTSPDGILLMANEVVLQFEGIPGSELIGQSIWDTPWFSQSEESAERIRRVIHAAAKGHENRFQMDGIDSRNMRHILDISVKPVKDDHGNIIFLQTEARDITDMKRVEQRLGLTVEEAGDGFFIHEVDGKFVDVNREACSMTGYSRDELLQMSVFDLEKSQDSQDRLPALWSRLEPLKYETIEGLIERKDGSLVPIEARIGQLNLDEHHLVLGLVRDITERKTAEESLFNSRERLRALFDQAFQLAGVLDLDGTVQEVNATALDFIDAKQEGVVGQPIWEAPWWRHDSVQQERLREAIKSAASGEMVRFDTTHIDAHGEVHIMDFSIKPIWDMNGSVVSLLPEGRDITERKHAEEELARALKEVEQLKEEAEAENVYLRGELELRYPHSELVFKSKAMTSILQQVEKVAPTDSTVLILGETGTGKELLARAIHRTSSRRDRPLVIVNCGAIPDSLIESELFGREKGAYTGASTRQAGRFEVADRGTIFLDEVGELSMETQSRLLRVLQEREFERLGSTATTKIDVRVIAASNRDLENAVREGTFRGDLFHRLNVFPIAAVPLRERQEDIEPLIWNFVEEFSASMGRGIESISGGDLRRVKEYSWPGNVRELRNAVERAMIEVTGPTLRIVVPRDSTIPAPDIVTDLESVDRSHIQAVLEQCKWRVRGKNGAADLLGLKPSTLESKMKKLGIRRHE